MSAWLEARFALSAAGPADLPADDRPELVFAGRSNVGKSSALNALVKRKRLAFASRTPGRTQTINFFDLAGIAWLVDLPGYGFAKAPQAVRAGWDRLVGGYLTRRRSIAGIVLLMDARHPLAPADEHFLDWLRPLQPPCLVLLSKCDKLSRAERAAALVGTRRELARREVRAEVLLFSSKERIGVDDVRTALESWLRDVGPAAGIKSPR